MYVLNYAKQCRLMRTLKKVSKIHGEGLFALKLIHTGEIVVRWQKKELSPSQFESLSNSEKMYVGVENGKKFLMEGPARYINHSCAPNTVPGKLCDIALRDIQPGEEITTDYKDFFIPSGSFTCTCKHLSCRRVIHGRNSL